MPRPKKVSKEQPSALPPEASLLGLPAELRNTIYHLVAEDIDEANIIGRKIGFGAASAEDRFWETIAKHPLGQTCRQLRLEFGSIHRHLVMTTGVPRYHVLLENYDLDRLGSFARLLNQVPFMLTHLKSSIKARKMKLRFCLNQKVEASVKQLRSHTEELDRLNCGPRKLSVLFTDVRRYLLGGVRLPPAEVILNLRNHAMSTAEKRIAMSGEQNLSTKRALKELCRDLDRRFVTPRMRESVGRDVVEWLSLLHDRAHTGERRKKESARAAKETAALKYKLTEELKTEIEAELKAKMRAELEDELRERLRKELLGDGHKK